MSIPNFTTFEHSTNTTSQWTLGVILNHHKAWLRGDHWGRRADLRHMRGLRGINLAGADLRYAKGPLFARGANLWKADLQGANLGYSDLSETDLTGANLAGADLSNADLTGADLTGANLAGANLSNTILRGAILRQANLCEADLREANLWEVDLQEANLGGTRLAGADLCKSNLAEVKNLQYAQVAWSGHGERGRQLLAVRVGGEIRLWCGCFSGSPDELRAYIAEEEECHRASRTKALDFVLSCCMED